MEHPLTPPLGASGCSPTVRGIAVAAVSLGYFSLIVFSWKPFGMYLGAVGLILGLMSLTIGNRGGHHGENVALAGVGLAAFYRSSYTTGREEVVPQPVAFSHAHHVGQLGIHCLYCHSSVEDSHFANIPPTATCVNCHQQMWHGSDMLAPVRASFQTDKPIVWNRVHNVPHYAYFNHSIHVAKGVGSQTCHGQIDEMNLTFQAKTLLMEWCINCHRNPHEQLRPKSEVYSMTYAPGRPVNGKPPVWVREDLPHWGKNPDGTDTAHAALVGQPRPTTQAALGAELVKLYDIRDGVTMTSCSMCHR